MYNKEQIEKVKKVLKNNLTNYWTGEECKKFENEFSKYHNLKYSICVSNGSVALELAIKSLGLKKNDEIIVTPRSFIISASSVINLGFKPVFADVDDNGNLCIDGIKKVYTKNIKAIILVHLNGLSCDLDSIANFAKIKKLFLIEDCSQAHGAIYKKKKVGSFGDISTWSFCQNKIISTGGEGGMISTNNKKLWMKCWQLKDHGKNYYLAIKKNRANNFRWLHDFLGSNHRMTEMQAAIGRIQLKGLDRQIKKRDKIVNLYFKYLSIFWNKLDLFKKPNFYCKTCPQKDLFKKQCNQCRHAYYRLNLYLNTKKINQIKLINQLNSKKILSGVGSCSEIYKEKIFKKMKIFPKKKLRNAELLGKSSISFLINPFQDLNTLKKEIKIIRNTIFMHKKIDV